MMDITEQKALADGALKALEKGDAFSANVHVAKLLGYRAVEQNGTWNLVRLDGSTEYEMLRTEHLLWIYLIASGRVSDYLSSLSAAAKLALPNNHYWNVYVHPQKTHVYIWRMDKDDEDMNADRDFVASFVHEKEATARTGAWLTMVSGNGVGG